MTPTIAVIAGREPPHRYSLHKGYIDALWAVGAMPVVLTPPPAGADLSRFLDALSRCDGLLLTGGGDVNPAAYGEQPTAPLLDVDSARDHAEIEAARVTVEAGRPLLGICRGLQVMTVALGGTLHQDLTAAGYCGHWDEERQHEPVHAVRSDGGTTARMALAGVTEVNSIHHQAVRDPGPELLATAWSHDGVVEAVESRRALGVQWHPERLADHDARHLAPFAWLCEAAA
jgi:gamma-glutamyl-gamma-aminobutyrate hydrolase PuuD